MKTKPIISILSFLLLLSSCKSTPSLSLYINEYETFNEFKSHLSILNSANDEGTVFAFEPNFDDVISKEYKVIGVDYEHKHGHKDKDGKICDTLYYRESFVLINMTNDNETFVVSFGLSVEHLDFDNLEWHQKDDTKYNYSKRYLGDCIQYVLTDSQNAQDLLFVKFKNHISETSIISILDNIKIDYKEANYV